MACCCYCEIWYTSHTYQWINRYVVFCAVVVVVASDVSPPTRVSDADSSPQSLTRLQMCTRWILMGFVVLSWILSVVTLSSCEFYELDHWSSYADGVGLFRAENEIGRCVNYHHGYWEWYTGMDTGARFAKTAAVMANLSLVASVGLFLLSLLHPQVGNRGDIWAYASCHTILLALGGVLSTFSFAASDIVTNVCGKGRQACSLGPAGASNVVNLLLLVGVCVTAQFVPPPMDHFQMENDFACCKSPTIPDEEKGIEANASKESKREAWNKYTRTKRLNGNVELLYHQTSKENAEKILREKKMMRGQTGLVGGGIYFCKSINLTHGKAHQKGHAVIANVKLGRVKTVSAAGDSTITFRSLLKKGYDSVRVSRSSGEEYVVYNYDQVQVMGITQL